MILSTEGFVLRKRVLLGADVMVVLMTREFGKLVAIAKGIRNFRSKRAPHLQTGNLVSMTLHQSSSGVYYIQSTDLISGFTEIRTQENTKSIYTLLSIIDTLLPEGQSEHEVYKLTKQFFVRLSRKGDPEHILHNSFQSIMMELGYIQQSLSLPELFDVVEEHAGVNVSRHVIM